jgi:hypothetical protein
VPFGLPGGRSGSTSDLRVTVRRTGGVTGIARIWSVTASELPLAAAVELRRLLAATESGRAPSPAAATLPDAFTYDVEVADSADVRVLTAGDCASPESLRALVEFVRSEGQNGTP